MSRSAALAEADRLVAGLLTHPDGQVAPSSYETARLVMAAPWLEHHDERVRYLLDQQKANGSWGHGSVHYQYVPTLAATAALLHVLRDRRHHDGELVPRTRRALEALERFSAGGVHLPDAPAYELTTPDLTDRINDALRTAGAVAGLDEWSGYRLPLPPTANAPLLERLRSAVRGGASIPAKIQHSLEILGDDAAAAKGVTPVRGVVGSAPAATAAWLSRGGRRIGSPHDADWLRALAVRHRGPVATSMPVTNWERVWVVNVLLDVGLDMEIPEPLLDQMRSSVTEHGVPGGPGLPYDADTTSATLTALLRSGIDLPLSPLMEFDTGSHFATWHGETNPSATTNAHVLEFLNHLLARHPGERDLLLPVTRRVSAWLTATQHSDGYWEDKWHASPYYASACAVQALRDVDGTDAAATVARSVDWVLRTQRDDGSWGVWEGNAEETAYALTVLRRSAPDRNVEAATARALPALRTDSDPVPLWHGKELYAPTAIVAAVVLAARHAAGDTMLRSTRPPT